MSPDDFLTTGQAAKLTGFSISKIRRLVQLGRIPAVDTTTETRPRWAIRRRDLEAFLTPKNVPVAKPERPAAGRRRRLDADVPQVC